MEIIWTEEARKTLREIFAYIRKHFTEKEVDNFVLEIVQSLKSLKAYPKSFPKSESKKYKSTRRIVIHPHTTLLYRVRGKKITLMTFWDNRKNPSKIK